MPAALPADWTSIRILASQGCTLRELAETTGIAEGTLFARSAREGWKLKADEAKTAQQEKSLSVAVQSGQMQARASNGQEIAVATLENRHKHTKLGLSLFTARAARTASRLPKDQLLAAAPSVKAVADIAGKVWPEQATDDRVPLQFFSITLNQGDEREEKPVVDV